MSASLVGSEMCIRDSACTAGCLRGPPGSEGGPARGRPPRCALQPRPSAMSFAAPKLGSPRALH
eukprot:2941044-Alexandrium_andersonii.AAC.1